MNFKDIIYEMLINENTDKRKAIERAIGFSAQWADEFYQLNEKYCVWVANSFLNDYVLTHKKTIEKKYNKPIKGETELKRAAREILNTTGPRNLIWKEDYEQRYKYIFDWLTSPRIANRVNVKILSFKEALEKSTVWHESLEEGVSTNYTENNEIIIDYRSNGVGFYWANLNTSMSEEEKRRMGHCGNDPGKVIFSLRSIDEIKDGRSHVTISYDPRKKTLGQMKGPRNRKPKAIFHKYIIDMILNKKYPIKGFEKNIYGYDTNFHLSDLTDEEQKYIFSKNKDVKMDYLFSDKKKLYVLADNNDVVLFKEQARHAEPYFGIVNVDNMDIIKDYEYVLNEESEFTDTVFVNSTWFLLKDFKSVKTGDEFIILVNDPTGPNKNSREFKFISKEMATKLIDDHNTKDEENSIAK